MILATVPFALSYSILISHYYFIIFIAPGCAIGSDQRVDCFGESGTEDEKVPFITPELCLQKGCCYDDMYMAEPNTWFYKPPGRTWCFKKEGGGKVHISEAGEQQSLLGTPEKAHLENVFSWALFRIVLRLRIVFFFSVNVAANLKQKKTHFQLHSRRNRSHNLVIRPVLY